MSTWPFDDPENVVSVTVRQVMDRSEPILLVCHDEDDGGWQFLTGGSFSMQDALLVTLRSVTELDPSILELADLPLGWQATRATVEAAWERSPS
ncbi:MAG TPA: hypothetical protein VJM31_15070 [Vicinamibacterales bacterium]|nr:hypothetical protein [Vicinamibacterales bacterium]